MRTKFLYLPLFNPKINRMAINFFLQSKKNPATIYVRLREGRKIDAKSKTKFKIDPEFFKQGKVRQVRMKSGASAEAKEEIRKQNKVLNKLQKDLDSLRSRITSAINNREEYEIVNSQWLKEVVDPPKRDELPTDLTSYFDYYLRVKGNELKPSTRKKIGVFKNRIEAFQKDYGKVYVNQVNKKIGLALQQWCDKEDYAHNTKLQTLKVLLTICNHAKEHGIHTHPELEYITKGMRYHNAEHIHLTFDELKKIAEVELETENLQAARDWLIISCYTAQRVSDFLKFSSKDLILKDGIYFLRIKQEKTEKPVELPVMDEALEIIKRRNGEFPPIFSKKEESNKTLYNRLIKKVCRIAKIKDKIEYQKRDKSTNRYTTETMPKWKAVSSHIGRRSFATNFYGEIPTPLLIAATGHSSERQFLRYVGGTGSHNAIALAGAMEKFFSTRNKEPKLEVIKNASNQN